MKQKLIRFLSIIACVLLLIPVGRVEAFGADSGSITVDYPYIGSEFSLYRVGDIGADGSFIKTGDFVNVPVELGPGCCMDPYIADTVAGYVRLWQISPDAQAVVDWENSAKFPGLSHGLYLVLSNKYTVEGKTYTAKPVLVSVPTKQLDSDYLHYDVTISPKPGEVPPEGEPISLKVLKVWKDDEMPSARPPFVTVYLLCDGEVYESTIIWAKDNWRYTWEGLESGHVWTVVEEAVKLYSVSIEQNSNSFVITNTLDKEAFPSPTPIPSPTPSVNPGIPQLPQSGLLWWPVPVLAGIGFVMFLLGYMLDRRAKDEN